MGSITKNWGRNWQIEITSVDPRMQKIKEAILQNKLICLVLVGLLLKMAFIPFAQPVNADGFARIALSERWLSDPYLISEGVWPPLHYYFTAIAIWISGEHVISTMILHILFSVATLIPLFYFTRREFNEKGAYFVVLIYLLSPIVFRNSYHNLSEIPHAFFIAMAMNFLSKALRGKSIGYALYAGFSMTMASGFRYEAWLLLAIFCLLLLIKKEIRVLIVFLMSAMIFPLFWMIGNYLAHKDIFYGLTGAYNWNVLMEGVNDQLTDMDLYARILFFPFSWFLLFSPIIVFMLFFRIMEKFKERSFDKARLLWALPFFTMLVVFLFKAYNGTLLLHDRFSISLLLLSLPFGALLFENEIQKKRQRIGVIAGLATLPFIHMTLLLPYEKVLGDNNSFGQAFKFIRVNGFVELSPIPKITDPEVGVQLKLIKENVADDDGVILDFDQWSNTSNLALNAKTSVNDVIYMDGAKNGTVYPDELRAFIDEHSKGVLLYKCRSKLERVTSVKGNALVLNLTPNRYMRVERIYFKDGISIFKYETLKSEITDSDQGSIALCPEEGSREYYRMKIKNEITWFNDISLKAFRSGNSLDEQLNGDAEWIIYDRN